MRLRLFQAEISTSGEPFDGLQCYAPLVCRARAPAPLAEERCEVRGAIIVQCVARCIAGSGGEDLTPKRGLTSPSLNVCISEKNRRTNVK